MNVAINIVQKKKSFLLIERVKQEGSLIWAFPGGKQELTDRCLEHTALRETFDETGILSEIVRKLGERQNGLYKMHYFLSNYLDGEIILKDDEVKQAGWYLKDGIYQRITSPIFSPIREYIDTI